MGSKVSVVIPYFQRKPGILKKAVLSVLNQSGDSELLVIVVDDGSPIRATDELQSIIKQYPNRVRVIEQDNSGPGAARNLGLENVGEDTEYVAFLDSDDEWMDGHIQNAISALEYGYNFYFSDFYFPNYKEQSAIKRAGKLPLDEHLLLDEKRQIYKYLGKMFDQILIKGNVIGTSNVVYRFRAFPKLRFREEFFNGQDYFFWLDYASLDDRIVFSSNVECDCGTGVNIYSGAGWGTSKSLARLRNEIKLWKSVAAAYSLTSEQHKANQKKLAGIRENLIRSLLHSIATMQKIDSKLLLSILKLEPTLPLHAVVIVLRIVFEKGSRIWKGSRNG